MQIRKTAGPALLLFALTAAAANIAVPIDAADDAALSKFDSKPADVTLGEDATASDKIAREAGDKIVPVDPATLNKKPGSVDAPVDGLDGKPHDGPGLFETAKAGTGEVGVSSGKTHVDLKKPPPHTGDHEIVDLEEPKEGEKVEAKVRDA